MKVHLLDLHGEVKVPEWNESKINGYKIARCGYQRKLTTLKLEDVTCKTCLKECEKLNITK